MVIKLAGEGWSDKILTFEIQHILDIRGRGEDMAIWGGGVVGKKDPRGGEVDGHNLPLVV